MTEYCKTDLSLYKIIDTTVYRYYYETKDWRYYTYFSRQNLLYWHYIPLTLLDITMMGILE